jgi:hypothetical protein
MRVNHGIDAESALLSHRASRGDLVTPLLLRATVPVVRPWIVAPFVARKIRRRSPAFSDAHQAGLAIRVVAERSTRIRMNSTAKRNARMALTLWQRRKTKWAVGQNRRRRRISGALLIRFILHVFSISLFATSKHNMRINQGINSLPRFHDQSLRESSAQWIGSFLRHSSRYAAA